MSRLAITFIDVGWGDSILLDTTTDSGDRRFGLIDCNDTTNDRSSYVFIKRYLERSGIRVSQRFPVFDFVLLTHAHEDHGSGLQSIFRDFGTISFWYPKSVDATHPSFGRLIRYANRYKQKVNRHEAVSRDSILPSFGGASMAVLWPPYDQIDTANENNNSVVLAIALDQVTIVTTGDAEASIWPHIVPQLPAPTHLIQAPHHGARNGTIHIDQTPWLSHLGSSAIVAMSSHIVPFGHPHPDVVAALDQTGAEYYRTDRHYHVTVQTNGDPQAIEIKWSRM